MMIEAAVEDKDKISRCLKYENNTTTVYVQIFMLKCCDMHTKTTGLIKIDGVLNSANISRDTKGI